MAHYGRESTEIEIRKVKNGWTLEDDAGNIVVFKSAEELAVWVQEWAERTEQQDA